MENLFSDMTIILLVMAAICTLISVITEFTKEIGFLSKIPTDFQVLVLSYIICMIGLFTYLSYFELAFFWYYLPAVVFAAFVLAIVCTKGWDYLFDIWKRFFRKEL